MTQFEDDAGLLEAFGKAENDLARADTQPPRALGASG